MPSNRSPQSPKPFVAAALILAGCSAARAAPQPRGVVTGSRQVTPKPHGASASPALAPRGLWHDGDVRRADGSADGRRIATAGDDASVKIWDARTGAQLATCSFEGTYSRPWIPALRWSPSGDRLAILVLGIGNSRLAVWDAVTGHPPTVIASANLSEIAESFAWSPDGRRLAYGLRQGGRKHVVVRDVPGPGSSTVATSDGWLAAWSPDSAELAVATESGLLEVWRARGSNFERAWSVPSPPDRTRLVTSLAWSRDRIAMGDASGLTRVFSAGDGRIAYELSPQAIALGPEGPPVSLAFSPDGARLAVIGREPAGGVAILVHVRIVDSRSGRLISRLPDHLAESAWLWRPDGRVFATTDKDAVRFFRVQDGSQEGTTVPGGLALATGSAGELHVVSRGGDAWLHVIDWKNRRELRAVARWPATFTVVRDVAFSPDGRTLVVAADVAVSDASRPGGRFVSAFLARWDLDVTRGRLIQRWHHTMPEDANVLRWRANDVLGAQRPGPLVVWDAGTGARRTRAAHGSGTTDPLIAESENGVVAEGRAETRPMDPTLPPDTCLDRVHCETGHGCICVRRAGQPLYQPISIVAVHDRRGWRELRSNGSPVVRVAISRDGARVAAAGSEVVLWDVARGALLHRWPVTTGAIRSLVVSPDGRAIALCSDKAIRLFDARTYQERTLAPRFCDKIGFLPGSHAVWTREPWGLLLWRIADGARLQLRFLAEGDTVRARIVTPEGRAADNRLREFFAHTDLTRTRGRNRADR